MNTFYTQNKNPNEITVGDRLLSSEEQALINKMKKSIEEIGLSHPIQITEDNKLIDGFIRLEAMKTLKLDIPCIIIKNKNENELKLIEIDNNIIRRQLSQWQLSLLLKAKKDIYEALHPSATRKSKVINNLKDKEVREETEDSYSKIASEEMDCSEKNITNKISDVEKIEAKNTESIDLLSHYEKSTNNKLKGVEINAFANLSIEDMKKFSKIIEEKISNNEKFKISDILTNENKRYSKNEQLNMILEYDIQSFKKDLSNYDSEKIELIKNFKKTHNVDFRKTIEKNI